MQTRNDIGQGFKSLKTRRGQPCDKSSGWYGLRGACERAKKGASASALKKTSAKKLADKIRNERGMKPIDRNPKAAKKQTKPTTPKAMEAFIRQLDRGTGGENYTPIHEIIKRSGVPKKDVIKMLYALQKADKIELGTLQEQKNYTAAQIKLGSIESPSVGGMPLPPLFFVSTID